jgi:glucosamine-6-phosphate deaminase
VRNLRTRVFPTPRAAGRALAAAVSRAVAANPALVLGLPTGRTPIPFYRELTNMHQAGRVDLAGVQTFNLDEFVGVPPSDPRSYRAFMQRHLFNRVNIPRRRIHFLNGAAPDLDAECRRFEQAIEEAGGIALQMLGIGANGHIGFNEPGRFLVARTHLAWLTRTTRRANASLFNLGLGGRPEGRRYGPADVPRQALSMGVATILEARRIVLLATGASKAACVARMVSGPITTRLPASFLQLHRAVEIWLDRPAAARLRRFK